MRSKIIGTEFPAKKMGINNFKITLNMDGVLHFYGTCIQGGVLKVVGNEKMGGREGRKC
jgi:hypothetical protein